MKKNRPECWGTYHNRHNPELQKIKERASKRYDVELPILPNCPCRFIKSCLRYYNKMDRTIMDAINNPRSR